ncbi:restriction endonuclease subunit S [Enterococcus viikkiensis]
MKSEWREKKLVELASYKTGKLNSNAAEENGIYPFFTTAPTTYRINSWAFDQEAILLGGNNANGIFTLKMYSGKFNAYQRTYVIAVDETAPINNPYLYYSLKLQLGLLKDISIGSATKFLTKPILDNIVISYPSNYSQMLQIVECLSSLDSKIELNNQMIATLEELAATLFKRWFVDFEFPDKNGNPCKFSGGKMVDSELGEIPEGWQNGTLSDIGEIVGGGTPSKKMIEYYIEGNIPWITPKDLSEQKNTFISNGKTNITELGLKKSSAKMIPEKSVLFSSRAPIGYIAISTQPVSTNQGFKSIIPKKSKHYSFVYLLLKSQVNNIESRATGSTFKEVSGTIMKNFPIILPKESILNDFSKLTDSIFKLILNLEVNVNNLEQTRNLVLPKLLSGELEV